MYCIILLHILDFIFLYFVQYLSMSMIAVCIFSKILNLLLELASWLCSYFIQTESLPLKEGGGS